MRNFQCFVISVEEIIYLLLHNLHDCAFKFAQECNRFLFLAVVSTPLIFVYYKQLVCCLHWVPLVQRKKCAFVLLFTINLYAVVMFPRWMIMLCIVLMKLMWFVNSNLVWVKFSLDCQRGENTRAKGHLLSQNETHFSQATANL